jgi:hypothetical protein
MEEAGMEIQEYVGAEPLQPREGRTEVRGGIGIASVVHQRLTRHRVAAGEEDVD